MSNYCVNCKWHQKYGPWENDICTNPICVGTKVNPITGQLYNWKTNCVAARFSKCNNGALFEPKPEPVSLFGKLKGLFHAKKV